MILLIILKNRILPYSAIKIKANPPDPYSILNPETSSDSPSAKSKGVRLVSARQEINHININGAHNGNNSIFVLFKVIECIWVDSIIIMMDKIIRERLIS